MLHVYLLAALDRNDNVYQSASLSWIHVCDRPVSVASWLSYIYIITTSLPFSDIELHILEMLNVLWFSSILFKHRKQ